MRSTTADTARTHPSARRTHARSTSTCRATGRDSACPRQPNASYTRAESTRCRQAYSASDATAHTSATTRSPSRTAASASERAHRCGTAARATQP